MSASSQRALAVRAALVVAFVASFAIASRPDSASPSDADTAHVAAPRAVRPLNAVAPLPAVLDRAGSGSPGVVGAADRAAASAHRIAARRRAAAARRVTARRRAAAERRVAARRRAAAERRVAARRCAAARRVAASHPRGARR